VLQHTDRSATVEYRILHKDGGWVWVESTIQNLLNNPDVGMIFIACRDISQRKRDEEALRISEARFRTVVENSSDGIIFCSADGTIVFRSPSYTRINGYSPEERLGHKAMETVHPDDQEKLNQKWRQLIQQPDQPVSLEYRIRHKNGGWVWVEGTAQNLIDNPDVGLFCLTCHPIDERKRAEEILRASEERYHSLFDNIDEGIAINQIVLDENGDAVDYIVIDVNPAFAKQSPVPQSGVVGQRASQLYQMTPEFIRAWWKKHALVSSADRSEYYFAPRARWFSLVITPPHNGRFATIFSDITERKRIETALIIKDRVVETSLNAIAVTDLDGSLTYVNPAFLKMWGYSDLSEVLGRPAVSFWQSPATAEQVRQAMLTQGWWVGELNALRRDGSPFVTQLVTNLVTDSAGQPLCGQASFIDITERRRAEERLRQSEADLAQAQRIARLGSWRYNLQTSHVSWTEEMFRVFDIDPHAFSGAYNSYFDFIHPDDQPAMRELSRNIRQTGSPFEIEYRIVSGKGRLKHIREMGVCEKDESGQVVAMLGTLQDITTFKLVEAALQQALADKQVLLQELQHRVKNSLAVASGLLGLEMSNLADTRAREIFASTQSRLNSMSAVYEMLYRTGGIDHIDLQSYLPVLVSGLAQSYLPDHSPIRIETRLERAEISVKRALPLGLILTELITNAVKYAFPAGKTPDGSPAVIRVELSRAGGQIRLAVSDNGVGLPGGQPARQGTGLSLVEMLVNQIDASFTMECRPGCTATITFPLE